MPSKVSVHQVEKAEEVVRLELQRREAKKRMNLLDAMLSELDQQAIYAAQFKKEWLLQRQALERERQKVSQEELREREAIKEKERRVVRDVHASFMAYFREGS